MTFALSFIGLAWARRTRGPEPPAPALDPVFRLANVLILIGRRPATGDTFRLLTATMGTADAQFASSAPLVVGERLDLLVLLFEGCPLRVAGEVAEVRADPGGWSGRLRFSLNPMQRAAMLAFLRKMGSPLGL